MSTSASLWAKFETPSGLKCKLVRVLRIGVEAGTEEQTGAGYSGQLTGQLFGRWSSTGYTDCMEVMRGTPVFRRHRTDNHSSLDSITFRFHSFSRIIITNTKCWKDIEEV